MLKKTLIALAALSSVAVMFPAQAQGWEHGQREGHQSQSPKISFVVYQHAERRDHRHHGYHQYRQRDHHQYRHHDYRQDRHHDQRSDRRGDRH